MLLRWKPAVRTGRSLGLLLGACLALAAAGCLSPAGTAQFAAAGHDYAGAVDSLLLAAGRTAVDASSERLLQDDALANQTLEQYQRIAAADTRRLEIIGRLRDHNRLLERYFDLLGDLAGSPDAEAIRDRLQGIARTLRESGDELGALPEFPKTDAAAVANAAQAVLGARLGGELRADAPTLRAAFRVQEALLRTLTAAIRHDFEIIREAQEQRLVIEPLLAPDAVKNPNQWALARRELLLLAVSIRELEKAVDLAGRLTADFDALLENRLNPGEINRLKEDAARLAAACKTLSK
ncbi:MAG: hypothetical protein WC708_17835 [Lentisphaeria bacterium]